MLHPEYFACFTLNPALYRTDTRNFNCYSSQLAELLRNQFFKTRLKSINQYCCSVWNYQASLDTEQKCSECLFLPTVTKTRNNQSPLRDQRENRPFQAIQKIQTTNNITNQVPTQRPGWKAQPM